MKKIFVLALLIPLLAGCGEQPSEEVLPEDNNQPVDVVPSGGDQQTPTDQPIDVVPGGDDNQPGDNNPPVTTPGYFKRFEEQLVGHEEEDVTFLELFDGVNNDYSVSFVYEPHFHLGLRIVDYSLDFEYIHPNEGTYAEDYESISFTLSGYFPENKTFRNGNYSLNHSLVNEQDVFTLTSPNNTFALTTTRKGEPNYINSDLIGKYEYKVGEDSKFNINVEVGERANGYPVTIGLSEGEKAFTTSNISYSGNKVDFTVNGNEDGAYISNGVAGTFSYSDNTGKYTLKLGDNSYALTEVEDDTPESRYFFAANIQLEHTDFKVEMNIDLLTGTMRRLGIHEYGYTKTFVLFQISEDGDEMTSCQNVSNRNIFNSQAGELVFKHRVENGVDKVDLYIRNTLAYSDIPIAPFVSQS